MHGPRPTERPIARLRLRAGVVRQRLIAAAWPGLAELSLEPARARRQVATVQRRPASLGGLPVPRSR